ncbi:MAG TPA: glycosyltransferase [Opitutaceae bacterium]|nr:glycosyltransferase [Opitutaceae bacterium]
MELLQQDYDIVAFGTPATPADRSSITLPICELRSSQVPYPCTGREIFAPFRVHLHDLEDELAAFDLVFTVDTYYELSRQAIEAKRRHGCRVVVLQSDNIPFNFGGTGENHIHATVRDEADHFVAIADATRRALLLEGVPERKVTTVPWGIDLAEFRNPSPSFRDEFRRRCGLPPDAFTILYTGRLVWTKGVFHLLYAAKLLLSDPELRNANVHVLLVGDGNERPELEAQARALGIENRIHFAGSLPLGDVPIAYSVANAFALPSIATSTTQEQFGQVLIEAMASGLPVIGSTCGAIPDVIAGAGVVVPQSDYVSLAHVLKRLALDSNWRRELGAAARTRVAAEFEIHAVAAKLKTVFEHVLPHSP